MADKSKYDPNKSFSQEWLNKTYTGKAVSAVVNSLKTTDSNPQGWESVNKKYDEEEKKK